MKLFHIELLDGFVDLKSFCGQRVDEIDCVIVPGVAFGPDGMRLGMGGGYYDSFLPKAARAVRIAAAFQCQITGEIPKLPHDCGVDWIVTEQGVFKTNQR